MPGLSFFESLYDLLITRRRNGSVKDTLRLHNKYGDTYRSTFNSPAVTISNPESIKHVLKRIEDFPKQDATVRVASVAFRKMFGLRSLVSINPPEWHGHRSLLNKSFTSNKVFFQPMQKKVFECISRWSHGKPVHVGYDIQKMTLDVLASCIFGQDFDTLNGHNAGPLAAYNFCIKNMFTPIQFIFPWWQKLPLPVNWILQEKVKEFDDYCWSIIAEAKKKSTNESECKTEDNHPKNFIDLMMDSGMSESDIRDNVGIFFLAGHETTSSTLSWAMAMLASHPEVQEKARKEVFEKTPNVLDYESIKNLEYIDWIVHETMRLHPAIPAIGGRQPKKEVVLGDWKIPENTLIQMDLASMLHDPHVWGDPEVFRPERWSPENLTKEQRTAWMPFSYGPRICIGMNFSLLEQKIFLSTLLREFCSIRFAQDGQVVPEKINFIHCPNFEKLKIEFVK